MAKFGFSQSVRRVEDDRFLRGMGQYSDDINRPGQTHGVVVRSPHAHARITRVDTSAAAAAPGVVGIVTGRNLADAGVGGVLVALSVDNVDGTTTAQPERPILCTDVVRYVGDGVAFVVAETQAQAGDAAALVEVDYEPLDATVETAEAAAGGRAEVHAEAPNNLAFDWGFGEDDATAAAVKNAAHVTRIDLINNRVVVNSMETRSMVASFDAATGKLTFESGTQGGWMINGWLAGAVLKCDEDKVRVITPDVGGGFGMKAFCYPEQGMVAWAARKFGRPVKWTAGRSESFISDTMGRDHVTHAELAFDADRRITGLRVETTANMGAYLSTFAPFIPTFAALKVLPGVYDVKMLHYRVKGVYTHTVPIDAYRGAGRPESIYLIERLIEQAARELGLDVAELRRKNFIPEAAMPFKTAAGEIYDTGRFEAVLDQAIAHADVAGFGARKAQSAARGKLRGIGMSYYIESTMGPPDEAADIRFADDGKVDVLVGTQSNGQGHETAYAQFVADQLGIDMADIRVVQGDTDLIPMGGGTGGSRSLTAEALAMDAAAKSVIERGAHYAAEVLEAAVGDIGFAAGEFSIAGTDRKIGILTLAAEAKAMAKQPEGYEGGLDAREQISVENWTFPNGCHVAEVEIDPETGVTECVRYKIVDDFGRLLNPLLVEGQVHGGVVQGIGQALLERTVYDADGQLVTGSFMDYTMPRADDMPRMDFSNIEVPCANNPFGIKGCGEAGTVASPGAVMNAVADALAEKGVRRIDMPATPEIVWRAIQDAA